MEGRYHALSVRSVTSSRSEAGQALPREMWRRGLRTRLGSRGGCGPSPLRLSIPRLTLAAAGYPRHLDGRSSRFRRPPATRTEVSAFSHKPDLGGEADMARQDPSQESARELARESRPRGADVTTSIGA